VQIELAHPPRRNSQATHAQHLSGFGSRGLSGTGMSGMMRHRLVDYFDPQRQCDRERDHRPDRDQATLKKQN
jgi:hypothetical protein